MVPPNGFLVLCCSLQASERLATLCPEEVVVFNYRPQRKVTISSMIHVDVPRVKLLESSSGSMSFPKTIVGQETSRIVTFQNLSRLPVELDLQVAPQTTSNSRVDSIIERIPSLLPSLRTYQGIEQYRLSAKAHSWGEYQLVVNATASSAGSPSPNFGRCQLYWTRCKGKRLMFPPLQTRRNRSFWRWIAATAITDWSPKRTVSRFLRP